VSVCPHDKTKTAETKIAKLGTGIVRQDISPTNELMIIKDLWLGLGDRVDGVSYALLSTVALVEIRWYSNKGLTCRSRHDDDDGDGD